MDEFRGYGWRWDEEIKKNLYLYWMRCDPAGGCAAFEKEIQSMGADGWAFFGRTLETGRRTETRPAVNWALKNSNTNLTTEAVGILMRHGEASDTDSLIAALQRLSGTESLSQFIADNARKMLSESRWHITSNQKKRLGALADSAR